MKTELLSVESVGSRSSAACPASAEKSTKLPWLGSTRASPACGADRAPGNGGERVVTACVEYDDGRPGAGLLDAINDFRRRERFIAQDAILSRSQLRKIGGKQKVGSRYRYSVPGEKEDNIVSRLH